VVSHTGPFGMVASLHARHPSVAANTALMEQRVSAARASGSVPELALKHCSNRSARNRGNARQCTALRKGTDPERNGTAAGRARHKLTIKLRICIDKW
jgi:hypothetical protein